MRKSNDCRGVVNWPIQNCERGAGCRENHDAWHDTGEGGMEAYLVLPQKDDDSACITGVYFSLASYDVVVSHHPWLDRDEPSFHAVVLLGSTGRSLLNPRQGFFNVSKEHLTPEGVALFDAIAKLFGREPEILTALDT